MGKVQENKNDSGYSTPDPDEYTGSDIEDDPKDESKTDIDDLVAKMGENFISRAPIRNSRSDNISNRSTQPYNVPVQRATNLQSGGGIISTSGFFNDSYLQNILPEPAENQIVPNIPLDHSPTVHLPQDEISQDSNLYETPVFQDLLTNANQTEKLIELRCEDIEILDILNENEPDSDEISVSSPKDIHPWQHRASFSTTSSPSYVSTDASPSSFYSDDQHSDQSYSPGLEQQFQPIISDDFIPKTVNEDLADRYPAKQEMKQLVNRFPKNEKKELWITASGKSIDDLGNHILELVSTDNTDKLSIRLYAAVEIFLKNATTIEACDRVFKGNPWLSDILAKRNQLRLQKYVKEIIETRYPCE